MKKFLSLFLALTVVLTVVGTIGTTSVLGAEETPVSAASGNTVYTEDFTSGTVTETDGAYTFSGLTEGFSVILDKDYRQTKDARKPSINGNLAVYLDSQVTPEGEIYPVSVGNNLAIGFPEITEGKASIAVTMSTNAKRTHEYFGALADTSDGTLNTVIAPMKRGFNSANATEVFLDGETKTVFGDGAKREYTYFVDMTRGKYSVESEGVVSGEYDIPAGAKINSLWFANSVTACNGIWIDRIVVTKYAKDTTVTFKDANGTVTLGTITVSGGQAVGTAPTAPEVEGKLFYGWVDANNNVVYDFDSITEDITLKAAYADYKIKEDFSSAVVVGSGGNYSVTGLKTGFAVKFGEEYNPKNSSQTKEMPPSISNGVFSTRLSSTSGNTIAISFPEITEGKASVAVTISTGAQTQQGHFAALADTDDKLNTVIAPLKRGKYTTDHTQIWLNDLTDVLYTGTEYKTYTYNIDLTGDTGKYSLDFNGETYGPYDIPEGARVNSLWFDNANATDNNGFSIDTIEFTKFEKDAVVTFKTQDGANELGKVTVSGGKVVGNVPVAPAVAGKVFAGWVDESGKVILNFADITKDTTLKATYVEKYIEETFDNATVNVDAETDRVSIATDSGLEFVLGSGKFQGNYASSTAIISGDTGSGIKVAEDAVNNPEYGKYLQMRQYTNNDTVAIKFPAAQSGTFAVSFDGKVGTRTAIQSYFGALALVDGDSVTTLMDVRRGRQRIAAYDGATGGITDGVWLNTGSNYRMAYQHEWHNYTYVVDMTEKKYTVKVDGEVVAEALDLPGDANIANALWFASIGEKANDQDIFIDNIRVEYDYKEAPVGVATIGITDVALAEGNVVVTYGLNGGAEGNGAASITGMPIAALYKDGALEAVTFDKTASVTLNAENATKTINVTAPSDWATNSGDYTVKVFIWNAETLAPQINVAVR